MKSKEELLKGDPSDIAGEIRDAIAFEGLKREQAGELIEYFMEKLNDKAQIIISQHLSREEREDMIEKHIKEMRMFEKINGKDSLEYFQVKYEYALSIEKLKDREQEEGFRIMLGAGLLLGLQMEMIGFPETRKKRIEKPDWEMVEEYCENLRDGPVVDLVPALKTAYLGDTEPNNKKLEAYCISIMDILQNKVKETLKKKMEKQALEEFVNELLPSVFKSDTAGKSEKSFWRRFPLLDYFKENARGNEIISAAHSIVSLYRKFIGFSSDAQDEYEYSNDPFHFFDDAPILTDGNPDGSLPAEAPVGSPEPVQGEKGEETLDPIPWNETKEKLKKVFDYLNHRLDCNLETWMDHFSILPESPGSNHAMRTAELSPITWKESGADLSIVFYALKPDKKADGFLPGCTAVKFGRHFQNEKRKVIPIEPRKAKSKSFGDGRILALKKAISKGLE